MFAARVGASPPYLIALFRRTIVSAELSVLHRYDAYAHANAIEYQCAVCWKRAVACRMLMRISSTKAKASGRIHGRVYCSITVTLLDKQASQYRVRLTELAESMQGRQLMACRSIQIAEKAGGYCCSQPSGQTPSLTFRAFPHKERAIDNTEPDRHSSFVAFFALGSEEVSRRRIRGNVTLSSFVRI